MRRHICRVFPGPLQRARMYKKWPHIPFLLSQPQYETDTREDWTVSQHTQPLRSPITFSHLVRRTHKHMYYVRAAWFAARLNNLSVNRSHQRPQQEYQHSRAYRKFAKFREVET